MAWLRISRKDFNMKISQAYGQFTTAQRHPRGLSDLHRDMIPTLVSSINGCHY